MVQILCTAPTLGSRERVSKQPTIVAQATEVKMRVLTAVLMTVLFVFLAACESMTAQDQEDTVQVLVAAYLVQGDQPVAERAAELASIASEVRNQVAGADIDVVRGWVARSFNPLVADLDEDRQVLARVALAIVVKRLALEPAPIDEAKRAQIVEVLEQIEEAAKELA